MSFILHMECPFCHKIIQTDEIQNDICPHCGTKIPPGAKPPENIGFHADFRSIFKAAPDSTDRSSPETEASPPEIHK
jgi:hypothetical protein